jgi:hypothetical protein
MYKNELGPPYLYYTLDEQFVIIDKNMKKCRNKNPPVK